MKYVSIISTNNLIVFIIDIQLKVICPFVANKIASIVGIILFMVLYKGHQDHNRSIMIIIIFMFMEFLKLID